MNKIKLFTDFEKISEAPHFGYVFPLIEYLYKGNLKLQEYYEVVAAVEDADFVVLPLAVEFLFESGQKSYYDSFLELAQKNKKKLLVFTAGDAGKTLTEKDVITIRLGGFKSKLPEHTFIMCPFIEDPLAAFKLDFFTIPKGGKPSVGFVGHSAAGFLKWVKEFLVFLKANFRRLTGANATDFQFFFPSSIKRYRFLKQIEAEPLVVSNFIFRPKYRAGSVSEQERLKTTLEFFANIQQNAFTFCMRGAGNFSVRFYETLAMGRIPIVVDTDMALPFSDVIDWSRHCVTVNEDFTDFTDKVTDFFTSLTADDFVQLQLANRKIWQNYFTREGYFITLQTELKKLQA